MESVQLHPPLLLTHLLQLALEVQEAKGDWQVGVRLGGVTQHAAQHHMNVDIHHGCNNYIVIIIWKQIAKL